MKQQKKMNELKYVAFLRGINVGGHHKVPMAELKKEMLKLNFNNIVTILNTGNIIFDSTLNNIEEIENIISQRIESVFGFPIPTIVREAKSIIELFNNSPFTDIEVTKDIRLYVSLLKSDKEADIQIPWKSQDNSYRMLKKEDGIISSVLDLSITKTPEAMKILEMSFGKGITTRNWNTIKRIIEKVQR